MHIKNKKESKIHALFNLKKKLFKFLFNSKKQKKIAMTQKETKCLPVSKFFIFKYLF